MTSFPAAFQQWLPNLHSPYFSSIVFCPSNNWCITHSSSLFPLFCFSLTPYTQKICEKTTLPENENKPICEYMISVLSCWNAVTISVSLHHYNNIFQSRRKCDTRNISWDGKNTLFLDYTVNLFCFDNFPHKQAQHTCICKHRRSSWIVLMVGMVGIERRWPFIT